MALFEIDASKIARWIDEEWGDRLAARKIRKLQEQDRQQEARIKALELELRRALAELRQKQEEIVKLGRALEDAQHRIATLRLVADAKIAGVAEATDH